MDLRYAPEPRQQNRVRRRQMLEGSRVDVKGDVRGALAPGSFAGTSCRGIPAWAIRRELPGKPCDAASSFGSFPGRTRQVRGAATGKGWREQEPTDDPPDLPIFAAEVGWSRPELENRGRDRIFADRIRPARPRTKGLIRTTNQRPAKTETVRTSVKVTGCCRWC